MDNNVVFKGIRKITDTPDGSLSSSTCDWPGILAMILRKIIKDQYDGKNRDGCVQLNDESINYNLIDELVENFIKKYYGDNITPSELKVEKNRLLTEFSRDSISIKVLGEFLMVLDLEWVDIKVTLGRRSGTVKSYTRHIGGVGRTQNEEYQNTKEFFDRTGIHDCVTKMPTSVVEKKKNKEIKPRKKRNSNIIK